MLKDFESGFVTEETEITVLLKDSSNGAAVLGDWLRPSVNFLASIDNDTGEMIKEEGRLEWMIKKILTEKDGVMTLSSTEYTSSLSESAFPGNWNPLKVRL